MTKLVTGLLTTIVLAAASCQPKVAETTQTVTQESLAGLPISDTITASTDVLGPADYDTLANAKADEYWENQQENTGVSAQNEYSFMGYLHKDHKSIILLTLHFTETDGKVTGKYFYHKTAKKQDLHLEGTKEGDKIQLTEYAHDGSITGRFTGELISSEYFEGGWSSPDGSKQLGFKMQPDGMHYEQRKKAGLKLKELEQD